MKKKNNPTPAVIERQREVKLKGISSYGFDGNQKMIDTSIKTPPVPHGCSRYHFSFGAKEVFFDAMTRETAEKKFNKWKLEQTKEKVRMVNCSDCKTPTVEFTHWLTEEGIKVRIKICSTCGKQHDVQDYIKQPISQ